MSYFTSRHIGHFGSWKMSWIIRKLIIAAAMCLLFISNLMVCAQSFSVLKNGCCFNGTDHEVGDIVAENQDSCLRFICGLDKGQHPSIVEVLAVEIPPDQCTGTPCRDCFDKSCVDESGMIRSQGSSWQPNDCSVCSCGPGQMVDCKALPITCPPQPSPSCVKVPGQCCPIWDCVSNHCVDGEGIRRKLNEEWGNPCILHLCTPTGIVTRIEDCVPIPVLNKSCELFTPEGRCCPELKCGCLDEEGKVREINEKWSNPGSPCFSHICTSSGTQTSIEDCFLPVANASCQVFTPEKQCCPELKCGCVNDEGISRELNEEWGTPCILHLCTPTGIVTRIEDCAPIPALNKSCELFTPEGVCCPELKCGCLDEEGKVREINEKWSNPGSPCFSHICTSSGTQTSIEDCFLLVANASCQVFTPEKQCCPELKCGDACKDNEGKFRALGEKWSDHCEHYTCTLDGIITAVVDCPPVSLPYKSTTIDPTCQLYTPKGACCPQFKCGCFDDEGQVRELDEEWGSPCQKHICSSNGIITRTYDCNPSPFVNATCKLFTPDDQCCPELRCGDACKDNEGKFRALGEKWSDRCEHYTCTLDGIITAVVDCPFLSPPLDPTCQLYTPKGACCPQFKCGCIDEEGAHRELGSEWHFDPCTFSKCTVTGITKSTTICKLGPKADPSCVEVTKEEECCPEWDCEKLQRGCLYNDKYYEIGEEFYAPGNPCLIKTCLQEGIIINNLSLCPYLRPNPWCVGEIPEGECCFVWTCSGCSDVNGAYIPLGNEWETDPCTSHVCTDKGRVTTKKNCTEAQPQPNLLCRLDTPEGECCPRWICPDHDPCIFSYTLANGTELENACVPHPEAPHPNCELHVPVGGCCQEWECGQDCRLVRCGLPKKPDASCVLFTPRLGCCLQWNCSNGCVDDNGDYHRIGEVSTVDPCTVLQCVSDEFINILVNIRPPCPVLVRPPGNCSAFTPPGKCCQEWKCGEDCNFVDCEDGPHDLVCIAVYKESCCPTYNCSHCIDGVDVFPIGEEWDVGICTKKKCTNSGIETIETKCSQTERPNDTCYAEMSVGVCCPLWICGCLDSFGGPRMIGSRWENDCTSYECVDEGLVHESPVQCILDEPDHFNCIPFTPLGECCPKWNCGTNCAVVLCVGPPQDCVADPLPPLSCCPTFSCPSDSASTCEIGSVWQQNCLTYNCTTGGIKVYETPCFVTPPPHEGCELMLVEGKCCLEWDCLTGTDLFPDEAELVIPVPP